MDSATNDSAVLSFDHPADTWPWHYIATQTLTLRADSLDLALSVENRDSTPMPAGLGWHPYFHKGQGAQLKARV